MNRHPSVAWVVLGVGLLFASGCGELETDVDGDGCAEGVDCEVPKTAAKPGAIEERDGEDGGCDGEVDQGAPSGDTVSYPDRDGEASCEDCDDADPSVPR